MKTLRVLLVENDPAESERIAFRLEKGSHAVLPATGLDEAAQALEMQRFDAVVLPSRMMTDQLLTFRESLSRFESSGKATARIPVLCYAPAATKEPTAEELERYRVDAYLQGDFEAIGFSQLVSNLASGVSASSEGNDARSALPVFDTQEFQEQLGFDGDLIVEILDLFLADSQEQLGAMETAFGANDLPQLSRLAHSLKGSLGSLYARRAASYAQDLEQSAKVGDRGRSEAALRSLKAAVEVLEPELRELRCATSGS